MVHPPHQPTVNHRRPRRDTVGADADLAERTRAGDREAFAELYRLTVDLVTRYVAVRMRERDRDAIDDLVHDAYCDALADPALLQADVVGSMLRLAARACTRHRWSTNRYVRAAYTVYTDRRTAYDPLDAARSTASATSVRVTFVHALARLTPDQRRAIQLQLIDGYPRDAAAKAMGKSIQAIGSLQSRALRQLRRQLASPTPAAEAPPPVADRLTAQAGAVLAQ